MSIVMADLGPAFRLSCFLQDMAAAVRASCTSVLNTTHMSFLLSSSCSLVKAVVSGMVMQDAVV